MSIKGSYRESVTAKDIKTLLKNVEGGTGKFDRLSSVNPEILAHLMDSYVRTEKDKEESRYSVLNDFLESNYEDVDIVMLRKVRQILSTCPVKYVNFFLVRMNGKDGLMKIKGILVSRFMVPLKIGHREKLKISNEEEDILVECILCLRSCLRTPKGYRLLAKDVHLLKDLYMLHLRVRRVKAKTEILRLLGIVSVYHPSGLKSVVDGMGHYGQTAGKNRFSELVKDLSQFGKERGYVLTCLSFLNGLVVGSGEGKCGLIAELLETGLGEALKNVKAVGDQNIENQLSILEEHVLSQKDVRAMVRQLLSRFKDTHQLSVFSSFLSDLVSSPDNEVERKLSHLHYLSQEGYGKGGKDEVNELTGRVVKVTEERDGFKEKWEAVEGAINEWNPKGINKTIIKHANNPPLCTILCTLKLRMKEEDLKAASPVRTFQNPKEMSQAVHQEQQHPFIHTVIMDKHIKAEEKIEEEELEEEELEEEEELKEEGGEVKEGEVKEGEVREGEVKEGEEGEEREGEKKTAEGTTKDEEKAKDEENPTEDEEVDDDDDDIPPPPGVVEWDGEGPPPPPPPSLDFFDKPKEDPYKHLKIAKIFEKNREEGEQAQRRFLNMQSLKTQELEGSIFMKKDIAKSAHTFFSEEMKGHINAFLHTEKKDKKKDGEKVVRKRVVRINLVDERLSRSAEIALKRVKMDPPTFIKAFKAFDEQNLSDATMEKIEKIVFPVLPQDIEKVKGFKSGEGGPEHPKWEELSASSQFYVSVFREIPNFQEQVHCWSYRGQYSDLTRHLDPIFDSFLQASENLINSRRFHDFLRYVLLIANLLAKKKAVYGFRLRSLDQLARMKVGGRSLLGFLIAMVHQKKQEHILDWPSEFKDMDVFLGVQWDNIEDDLRGVSTEVKKLEKTIEMVKGSFASGLNPFLSKVQKDLEMWKGKMDRVSKYIKDISSLFAEKEDYVSGPMFKDLKSFCAQLENAKKEFMEWQSREEKKRKRREKMVQKMKKREMKEKKKLEKQQQKQQKKEEKKKQKEEEDGEEEEEEEEMDLNKRNSVQVTIDLQELQNRIDSGEVFGKKVNKNE